MALVEVEDGIAMSTTLLFLFLEVMKMKAKLSYILISLAFVMIAGFFVNVANALTVVIPFYNKTLLNLILLSVLASIGFIVIPYVFVTKVLGRDIFDKLRFDYHRSLIVLLLLVAGGYIWGGYDSIHTIVIAICEEFLFRYILLNILNEKFTIFWAIIIGSLMFSIVLHLNGSFFLNVLTKFPASIILYVVYLRKGLQDSIAIHWFYNMIINALVY